MGTVTDHLTAASVRVDVVGITEHGYDARSALYQVLDRPKPVYALAPAVRSGTVVLLTRTAAERAALQAILLTGHPIKVTCDPGAGRTPVFDPIVVLPSSTSEEPTKTRSDLHRWVVRWDEVTDVTPAAVP